MSTRPFLLVLQQYLLRFFHCVVAPSGQCPAISPEALLAHLLSVPVPSPGAAVRFAAADHTLVFVRPRKCSLPYERCSLPHCWSYVEGADELPICELPLYNMVRMIGVPNLLLLLHCALLEKQILLCSSSAFTEFSDSFIGDAL